MDRKIEGMGKAVKEADQVAEQQLLQEVKASWAAYLEADARWVEQSREARLSAERDTRHQQWRQAAERWERLRFSLGLPFYDTEVGPPEWFAGLYGQPGLSRMWSEG